MHENLKKQIMLAASGQHVNDTRRVVCPDCGEKNMSITRIYNGVLYHCYRASCGVEGFIPAVDFAPDGEPDRLAKKVKPPKPYSLPLFPLEKEDTEYFYLRFHIDPDVARAHIQLAPESGRYAIRVTSHHGGHLGHILRAARWSGMPACPRTDVTDKWSPKTITYQDDTSAPFVGFLRPSDRRKKPKLFIVEDMISALRVASDGCFAVSLNGTHMSAETAADIECFSTLWGIDCVSIRLDPDAASKAMSMYRMYGMQFPKCWVSVTHNVDPKDDAFPATEWA